MLSNIDTGGLMLFCIGLLLRFVIGRRRFNRKNLAGLQVFPSYFASKVIQAMESIINLLGLILIFTGAVMMLK